MNQSHPPRQLLELPGTAVFVRLVAAWSVLLAAALGYCLLHGVVTGAFEFEPGVSIRWALVHWGGWPILLPLLYWLIRRVERRAGVAVAVAVAAPIAVLASACAAYLIDAALGGRWSITEAIYHMTPVGAGTYLVFLAVGFWMFHPSVLSPATNPAVLPSQPSPTIAVWKGPLQTSIEADSIEWARAARNYVEFFAGHKSYIARSSMASLEKVLPADRFLRVHRSYLVNAARIQGLRGGRTQPAIVLESGARVPVGKSYRESVFRELQAASLDRRD